MFHTDLRYYFRNIYEIYQKAGHHGTVKKTWRNSGKDQKKQNSIQEKVEAQKRLNKNF